MQLSSFRRKSSISRVIIYPKIDCSPLLSLVQCARFVRVCTHGSRNPITKNVEFSNQVIWGSQDVPNYPSRFKGTSPSYVNIRCSTVCSNATVLKWRRKPRRFKDGSRRSPPLLPVSKTSGSRWSPSINYNR